MERLKIGLLLVGVLCLIFLIHRINDQNHRIAQNDQNIKAMTDSLRVSNEGGREVYSKYVTEFDNIRQLRRTMPELFAEIKGIKNLASVTNVSNFNYTYNDTITNINTDSKQLNDSTYVLHWLYTRENRTLEGQTMVNLSRHTDHIECDGKEYLLEKVLNLSSSGTDILRDEMKMKVTVGVRKNKGYDEIFVLPNNENVIITDIKGARIEKKKLRWSIGPYVGAGVGVNTNGTFTPSVQFGIGIQYNIIKF
jgi:hypothetical protein